jgi:hypothetical protein
MLLPTGKLADLPSGEILHTDFVQGFERKRAVIGGWTLDRREVAQVSFPA